MKRLGSSDSLGALMSICLSSAGELNQESNPIFSRDFQTVLEGLDEEDCVERSGHISEKKRRLSVDQVKALEKNFEVENKLEPERKIKLAQEIGLQPRQIAVWFQNRRARYKTKQLERDYGILKANYDSLKHNYDSLERDNESLHREIREIKSKLSGDIIGQSERKVCVKEEDMLVSDTEEKSKLGSPLMDQIATELDFHNPKDLKNVANAMESGSVLLDFKDGSSDSTDSSAILNEENNSPLQFLEIQNGSTMNGSIRLPAYSKADEYKKYQAAVYHMKVEEHNFLGHEESCSTLFSDDQAPTLQWYCWD